MKSPASRSASTSGARSPRKHSDEKLNISLVRRELIPQKDPSGHWAADLLAKYAQLLLLVLGLGMFTVSGFSLTVRGLLLWGGLAGLCLLFTVFFFDNWLTGARLPGAIALTLTAAVVILFTQNALISGFSQLGAAILTRMNALYGGDYMLPVLQEDPLSLSIFFLLVFLPLCAALAGCVVYTSDAMLTGFLVFPPVALLLLCGAQPSAASVFCLLLGFVAVCASGRVWAKTGLWGEKGSSQWQTNRIRYRKVSSLSAWVVSLAACLLMLPSFFILAPSLSAPLAQTAPFAAAVEGRITQEILSRFTGSYMGSLSAPISAYGGGVADGSLAEGSGYLVSDMEDLRLTLTAKPEETLYLRGFIGGSYTQNQWLMPEEQTFLATAQSWETEGAPELYLHNLPFLRMLYEESQTGAAPGSLQLTVERLNANPDYTYTPYGCYLNEYYRICGDGSVEGQRIQDDIFPFYPRSAQQATLREEYFLQNESVLDRLERSYASFAREQYTQVPPGFEFLQGVCDAAPKDADLQTTVGFVQQYLWSNCSYSPALPQLPEGEDAIRYFLQSSHTGSSPQFASAATVLFRMLDIPARYVVGYGISTSLFTPQTNGTYQAIAQSDNAHAWTEIYISGTGWMPIETTPGQLGLVQDVEYYGPTLPSQTEPPETTSPIPQTQPPQIQDAPAPASVPWGAIGCVISLLAGLLGLLLLGRSLVRNFGLNPSLPASTRLRQIFGAYFRLLRRAGMPAAVDSASEAFPQWITRLDPGVTEAQAAEITALILESYYGNRPVKEKDVLRLRRLYRAALIAVPKGRIQKILKK